MNRLHVVVILAMMLVSLTLGDQNVPAETLVSAWVSGVHVVKSGQ